MNRLAKLKTRIINKWNTQSSVGSIFRNMFLLAAGNGAARVISTISMPIVTRIYLPEHMGVFSVFAALTAILAPFATLRYPMALPLPDNDGMAVNLAVLCGLLLLTNSILFFFLFCFLGSPFLNLISMEQITPYRYLLPIAMAGQGFFELMRYWVTREKAFKSLAGANIFQTTVGSAAKIGFGLLGLKPLGLLIAAILTKGSGAFILLRSLLYKIKVNAKHISRKRILLLVRYYSDFPKYRLPSQFLLILSSRAPLLFFAWHFGSESTGQLGLALSMIALPMGLFGRTTGQAYYAEIARIGSTNPEKIHKITKSLTKKLLLLSVPPFIILFFFGPWMFEIVFGEAWREAGVFASILAIYLLSQFLSSPLMNVFNVFNRQPYFFRLNIERVVLLTVIFMLTYFFSLTAFSALVLYSIVMSCFRGIIYIRVMKIIRSSK